ncbi:hypothetical protein D3C83_110300 [compost metagenome]
MHPAIGERARAALRVLIKGITAVENYVAGGKQRQQRRDRVVNRRAGRYHEP